LSAHSYRKQEQNFIAVEGMYNGQFIYCGKKAQIKIGNVLPLKAMPEGNDGHRHRHAATCKQMRAPNEGERGRAGLKRD
jgi:hypothetical protein